MPATPTFSATPVAAGDTAPPAGPSSTISIYLADLYSGAILIYSAGASGNTSPSAVIGGSNTGITDSTGSSPIFGEAVDPSGGTVYVLTQTLDSGGNATAETVSVFPAGSDGNVAPARTLALPTSIDAESLAYDAGSLYVTDASGTGAIDVFPAGASGNVTATRTFAPSGGFTNTPNTVAFDTSGQAYVATYDQTATAATEATQAVDVFASGASGAAAPKVLSGTSTGFGNGVLVGAAVDGSNRIDAVVDDQTSDVVADLDEFAAGATGNAAPATTFQDTSAQGPVGIAADAAGNLYVSEIAATDRDAQVNVFAPGATAPTRTILGYRSALPLIALGPYVAPDASASTPVSRARRGAAAVLPRRSRLRSFLAARRFAR